MQEPLLLTEEEKYILLNLIEGEGLKTLKDKMLTSFIN